MKMKFLKRTKTKNLHHLGLIHQYLPSLIHARGPDLPEVHQVHLSHPILVQALLSQISDITPGPGKREGGNG